MNWHKLSISRVHTLGRCSLNKNKTTQSESDLRVTDFHVAYTKCNPHNAMAQDIYSCICHGEQNARHMVYYPPG